MATIREVRKTLMPVVIGLSVLIVACIVYMLSPAGRSRQTRENEYQLLQTQVLATRKDVLPTRGMDGKLKQASTDIGGFYAQRFPAHYSVVAEELGKLATQTGVKFAALKYDNKDAPVEGLRKLNIDVTLSGDYLQEVKFINALERDKIFFLVDSVALGEQQGVVRLQLKLETYLRTGAVS